MIINNQFELNHITKIIFGAGMVENIGKETAKYGRKALIVCDEGVRKAGIVDKVTESLTGSGVDYAIYDKVLPNPRDTGVVEAAGVGSRFGADVIIGVGGGSAMDTAKAANVLMTNGGDCETWARIRKFNEAVLPVICVPTTSGTGSEVTFEAVITAVEKGMKVSISDGVKLAPRLALMDPELTLSVPPLVTASTGMDALTHALEAFTCTYSQPITDGLAMYAMEKIAGSIVTATMEGSNLKARTDMMVGSLMAGMAFTNSFLGSVHSLSERIGGFYDTPHGIANSIFLPFVTQYNMDADPEKHALVAKCLGIDIAGLSQIDASERGVEKIFELNELLGIPKFKDVKGVDSNDFPKISESCVTHACTKANPRKIDAEGYLMLLNKAYDY